jgi:hypothetical protein
MLLFPDTNLVFVEKLQRRERERVHASFSMTEYCKRDRNVCHFRNQYNVSFLNALPFTDKNKNKINSSDSVNTV